MEKSWRIEETAVQTQIQETGGASWQSPTEADGWSTSCPAAWTSEERPCSRPGPSKKPRLNRRHEETPPAVISQISSLVEQEFGESSDGCPIIYRLQYILQLTALNPSGITRWHVQKTNYFSGDCDATATGSDQVSIHTGVCTERPVCLKCLPVILNDGAQHCGLRCGVCFCENHAHTRSIINI
eukprot:2258406-Amphidinium_carterae.1